MSHYIRLDNKNRIIAGFSDAFEQPQEGDTCILNDPMQEHRHFELNDQINPPLIDIRGRPLYKWISNACTPCTDADWTDFNTPLPVADLPVTQSQLNEVLQQVDSLTKTVDSLVQTGS